MLGAGMIKACLPAVEKFGRIDYLVNNGGGQFPCPVADMSLKVRYPTLPTYPPAEG